MTETIFKKKNICCLVNNVYCFFLSSSRKFYALFYFINDAVWHHVLLHSSWYGYMAQSQVHTVASGNNVSSAAHFSVCESHPLLYTVTAEKPNNSAGKGGSAAHYGIVARLQIIRQK